MHVLKNVPPLLLALAPFALGGCATLPVPAFPVTTQSTDRVKVLSAYARPDKHGVRVAGFAKSRRFMLLPWGGHIHVVAELNNGSLVAGDASWRPSMRGHMPTTSYQMLLRDVSVDQVVRVKVEYRATRDE